MNQGAFSLARWRRDLRLLRSRVDGGLWLQRNGTRGTHGQRARSLTFLTSWSSRGDLSLLRGPASIDATAAPCMNPAVACEPSRCAPRPASKRGIRRVAWDCSSARPSRRSTARAEPQHCRTATARRSAARAPAPNPHDEQRAQGRTPAAAAGASAAPRGPRWRRHLCRRRGRRRGRHRGAARRKYARRTAAWRRAASRRGSSRAGGRRAGACPHCGRRFANRHAKHVAICGHASARAQARRVRSVAGVGNGERAGGASDGAGSLSARS